MRKFLAALALYCCAAAGHAACALSTEPQPRAVVGLQLFHADDPRSWAWADDLNVPWLRIELRWDWIEPYPGQWDAAYADRVMALASSHRPRKLMVLFNHAPAWAVLEQDLLPERAVAALSFAVQRYGAQVHAWEIFNEPNLPGYGWPEVGESLPESAALYALTLSAAGSAIRALDAKAFVVSAGLSPQGDPEGFARWMVRLTPSACYDALGLHPYGQQGRFAIVQRNVATLLEQEQRPPKPVWFTEYGTDRDDERAQLLSALASERSTSPITFFFTERDFGEWGIGSYGLRRSDGTAKPDYFAFKRLNPRLRAAAIP